MDEILALMNEFEKRNNFSITLVFCSDGSCNIAEFWTDKVIANFDNIEALKLYLKNVEYEKDKNGICISPVRIIKQ